MPKFFLILFVALHCKFVCADTLALGQKMPPMHLTTVDGEREFWVSHQDHTVYVLNFWATWCAPCKEEMPLLETFYQQHRAEGLEVIAISVDDIKKINDVKSYARQFSFPVVHKSEADIRALGRLWRVPSTFIIDSHGLLRKNGHVGEALITKEELERIVTPLLSGH